MSRHTFRPWDSFNVG